MPELGGPLSKNSSSPPHEVIRKPTQIDLEYIYCDHKASYVPKIVEAIGDASIIAIETVGGKPRFRKKREDAMNSLTTSERLSGSSFDRRIPPDASFSAAILRLLAGSGKQIVFIDASEKDKEAYKAIKVFMREDKDLTNDLYKLPSNNIERGMDRWARSLALSNKYREQVVRRQIDELIDRQQADTKIAIIQGAGHTSTSHEAPSVVGKELRTNRTFIGRTEQDVSPPEVFRYKADAQLIRHYMFRPEEPATRNLVRSAILALHFDFYIQAVLPPGKQTTIYLEPGHEEELLALIDANVRVLDLWEENKKRVIRMFDTSPYVSRIDSV